MVDRPGIGATAAAAVVFSVVLISSIAIYAASQSRASLYSESDVEDYLYDNSLSLVGASAANILLETQYFLGGGTFNCASAQSVIGANIATLSDTQSLADLNESAFAQKAPELEAVDNLSSLAPFNGSLANILDIEIRISARGGNAPAGVTFSKAETHLVHLPFRLDAAVLECLDDVKVIAEAVSGFSMENCSSSAVASFMGPLRTRLASASSADGFEFGLQYALTNQASCSLSFEVSVEQANIQGLGGLFDVILKESGSASFAQPGDVLGPSSGP